MNNTPNVQYLVNNMDEGKLRIQIVAIFTQTENNHIVYLLENYVTWNIFVLFSLFAVFTRSNWNQYIFKSFIPSKVYIRRLLFNLLYRQTFWEDSLQCCQRCLISLTPQSLALHVVKYPRFINHQNLFQRIAH